MSSSNIVFDTSFNGGVILPIITITYSGTDIIKFTTDPTFTLTSGTYSDTACNNTDSSCDNIKYSRKCPNDGNNGLFINFISVSSSSQCSLCCCNLDSCEGGYDCTFSCIGLDIDPTSTVDNVKTTTVILPLQDQKNKPIGRCILDTGQINFLSFNISNNDGTVFGLTSNEADTIINTNKSWSIQFINPPNGGNPFAPENRNSTIQMQFNLFNDMNMDISNLPLFTEESISNLNTIINNLSTSILPQACKEYLILTSYIYAFSSLFYSEIYQTIDATKSNSYLGSNCLRFSDFISNFNQICPYPTTSILPSLPFTSPFVNFPVPSQDGDNYYLTLSLSYQQVQKIIILSANNRLNYIYGLATNFLRDTEGILTIGNADIPLKDATFQIDQKYINLIDISQFDSYSYIMFDKLGTVSLINNGTYPDTTPPISFFKSIPNIGDKVIDTYQIISFQIIMKVVNWSTLLLAYFENFKTTFTYSDTVLSNIKKDIQTTPFKSFSENKTDIDTYCINTYNFKAAGPTNYTLASLIVNSETANACMCYTSHVAPSNLAYPNKSAMCFSNYCTSDILNTLGVSDNYCTQIGTCEDVHGWITAEQGSPNASANPSELNSQKFNQNCGNLFPAPSKYNTDVLIFGVVCTILFTLFTYLICKNNNESSFKTFLECFTVFLLSSITSYYLSLYLNGTFTCDGKNQVCQSKSLGKLYTIPNEFCKGNATGCECQQTSDCVEGCQCKSGNCMPENGKTQKFYEYRPKYITIFVCFIASILIPLMFVYASEDYNWHIHKKMGIVFVILLSLTPVIYSIVVSLKKNEVIIYDKC